MSQVFELFAVYMHTNHEHAVYKRINKSRKVNILPASGEVFYYVGFTRILNPERCTFN